MAVAPKCDVCSDAHWPHQAHRFVKPVAVSVTKATLDYMRGGGTLVASAEAWLERSCEVCGAGFDTKRSHARFCSAKCRQANSRKRRGLG